MACEMIALQCQSIANHIIDVHASDQIAYEKYANTYIIFFSFMDTATKVEGV